MTVTEQGDLDPSAAEDLTGSADVLGDAVPPTQVGGTGAAGDTGGAGGTAAEPGAADKDGSGSTPTAR